MTFAFNPDDGPARLFRYRPSSEFPHDEVLSILDAKNNTLVINSDRFEELAPVERQQLLRTHAPMTFATPRQRAA